MEANVIATKQKQLIFHQKCQNKLISGQFSLSHFSFLVEWSIKHKKTTIFSTMYPDITISELYH